MKHDRGIACNRAGLILDLLLLQNGCSSHQQALTHRSYLSEVNLLLIVLVKNIGMAFWVHVAEWKASC